MRSVRLLKSAGRWLRTVRYLRLVQIYGRLWFRLYNPSPELYPPPKQRPCSGPWELPARRTRSLQCPWVFRFLNVEHELSRLEDWNNPTCEKLWLYNLHYFDDLNAYGSSSRATWHRELLARWVVENPPAFGTGWEPYPTSLRIVNWIKWSLAGNTLSPECIYSLAVQARWLHKRLEFHLLGNHLFSNAKALVFAGVYFEGKEANLWLEKGFSILTREIPEQILSDGGQFERSPMYHALALEDMLDLCNVTSAFADAVPVKWQYLVRGWPDVVGRMRRWLATMCHPDREIAFFNDAAIGISPVPDELERYAEALGSKVQRLCSAVLEKSRSNEACKTNVQRRITYLSESGYLRLADEKAVALLDVAPVGPNYLPGHAHADTLSFELSIFGQRCIVNSGTSVYGKGQERQRQRGTAAHSTVTIDGENSTETWAGFRVGRRAIPSEPDIDEHISEVIISASHDGYQRLSGGNSHRRTWRFKSDSLVIIDQITGAFREAAARLHLHPDVKIETFDERGARLRLAQGQDLVIQIEGGELCALDGIWHPQFGVSIPNLCLVIKFTSVELFTTIQWDKH